MAYMSVKLIERDFKINSEVTHFKVKKYNCKIVYGYNYFDVSPDEPVRIKALIEMPNGEGSFNAGDKPFEVFLYKNDLYSVDKKENYTEDQMKLLVKHYCYKENEKFKKIQKEIELFESADKKRTDNDG
jgi:hypothetical protein